MTQNPRPSEGEPISITARAHRGHVGRWLFVAIVGIVGVLVLGALAFPSTARWISVPLIVAWTIAMLAFMVQGTRSARIAAVELLSSWPPAEPLVLYVRVPLVGKTFMTRYASSGTLTIADGWLRLQGRKSLVAPARNVVVAGTTPWLNTGLLLATPTGKQNISLVSDGVEVHLAQLIDHALAGPLRTLLAAHAAAHPDVYLPPRPTPEPTL